jgi:hypothetical protein
MAGVITDEKQAVFSSEIGIVTTKVSIIRGYDVEDFVKRKAMAQGRVLQYIMTGKNMNINSPVGERTIKSPYFKNDFEISEE